MASGPIQLVGPTYNLDSRPSSVQRTVNLIPIPQEPGNERTGWVFKDAPGLALFVDPNGPSGPVIGWMTDILDVLSTPVHTNNGIAQYKFGIDPIIVNESMFAGIVGYTSGTVVWTPTWSPLASDAAPTLTDLGAGKLEVHWPNLGGFPPRTSNGLLLLSVTIDGGLPSGTIEATSSTTFYTDMAWQPTP